MHLHNGIQFGIAKIIRLDGQEYQWAVANKTEWNTTNLKA